eukprot:364003-Chlamydomonas_euryale.AAC.12
MGERCKYERMRHVRVRIRVTGSGYTRGMPVWSVTRRRGSSSGLGDVTKVTPMRTVLSHRIQTPPRRPGRRNWRRAA